MTRLDRLLALPVSLAALTVYVLTLTPSLSYLSPDGSELATIPAVLGLAHSPGYPLYTWLGFLFSLIPIGDVAHRINLMSAVLGALGVGGLYLIIMRIGPDLPVPPSLQGKGGAGGIAQRCIAALAALLFAFSLDFWSQALIAEVYAPNVALIALTLLTLLLWERKRQTRYFILFSLTFGLSLGMHISDLGFAPAFVLFALLVIVSGESRVGSRESSVVSRPPFARAIAEMILLALGGGLGFALGAAQYLWPLLTASSLNDRAMLRNAPTSLAGLYNYTLGAFQNFRFAFPLTALPDRLVIYLDLLRQQFGLVGIALGVIGLFSLLFRRPRHFYLLVGMYLVHVWFFIQYRAFDLEVFFVPAHFLWAVFLAFGLFEILNGLSALWTRFASWKGLALPRLVNPLLAVLLLTPSLAPLSANWSHNDFSQDVAINDFYANVWEFLPQGAALVTNAGVFGYDAFYWQFVYGTRADVLLPLLPGPDPSRQVLEGRDAYSTTRAASGGAFNAAQGRGGGPGALPPGFISADLWQAPVLLGEQPEVAIAHRELLVLYHLTEKPPQLLVADPHPQIAVNADFGGATLLGVDISSTTVESGAAVEVTLYWKLTEARVARVETRLGGQPLEQHEVGFGLLERYAGEVGLQKGDVIVDRYWLVIPSNAGPGAQTLTIQAASLGGPLAGSPQAAAVTLTTLEITNQIGTVERWLQIAGK